MHLCIIVLQGHSWSRMSLTSGKLWSRVLAFLISFSLDNTAPPPLLPEFAHALTI